MKSFVLALLAAFALAVPAAATTSSATITGPSQWPANQPVTFTWRVGSNSNCASGVRVVLAKPGWSSQVGYAVALSSGQSTVSAVTFPAGTQLSVYLIELCGGNYITPAFTTTIVAGSSSAPPPSTSNPITSQVKQNIDSVCQTVLGLACSTTSSYASIYSDITLKISRGQLGSDTSSLMYSYLLPMVQSSTSWQANIVDNAWRALNCTGAAPESQWIQKYSQWQTYSQLYYQMHSAGCSGASANIPNAAPPNAAAQYVAVNQMYSAYSQVWGAAAGYATANTQCPVSSGAVSCARSALRAYVQTHGTGILQILAAPVYQQVVGQALDSGHAQSLFYQFGNYWTGADDLSKYLSSTASQWRTLQVSQPAAAAFAGINAQGCPVDTSGRALSSSCGMFFLSSSGAQAKSSYVVTVAGKRLTTKASNSPSGLLVGGDGQPVHIILNGGGNWQLKDGSNTVAAGGGNFLGQNGSSIVASGAGNIVASGAGNIVASGAGNIVASGGGNIVASGGGNFQVLAPAMAASYTGLISNGASVISNDGGSFLPALSSIILNGGGNIVGPSSGTLISNNNINGLYQGGATSVVNTNGSNVVSTNGGNASASSYSLQSVKNPVLVITGPAYWPHTRTATVTWYTQSAGSACTKGVQVLLYGSPASNSRPAQINSGSAVIGAVSWPIGTRVPVTLQDLCTNAVVSGTYYTTIN